MLNLVRRHFSAGMGCTQKLLMPLALAMLCACQATERLPTTFFSGPVGLALAGNELNYLFVANSGADTLQVVQIPSALEQADMVPAPARYFPLNIPTGPNPTDIAATADGHYVFVLDALTSTVELVDAQTFRHVQTADGQFLKLALGERTAQPTAMIGALGTCTPSEENATTTCLGRAYVGLRTLQSVAAIDVRQDSQGTLSLQIDRIYSLGAAPMRMALHPNQTTLFVTDADSADLLRLELPTSAATTPKLDRFSVGSFAGDLAISEDGTLIAVARPLLEDIVIFGTASGDLESDALVAIAPDGPVAPIPQCLQPCRQFDQSACYGAHEADLALCSAQGQVGQQPNQLYVGLYFGSAPVVMTALQPASAGRLLQERCDNANGLTQRNYVQAVAVGLQDGTVKVVGLKDPNGVVDVHLLDSGFCEQPRIVRADNDKNALSDILAPCVLENDTASRLTCLAETNSTQDVVGVMRSQGTSVALGLTWEGVLPGGDRSIAGGIVQADGTLADPDIDLSTLPILPRERDRLGDQVTFYGDIVEILTPPNAQNTTCAQSPNGGSKICQMERRIVAVNPKTSNNLSSLVLDQPLEPACFAAGVSYRIRAGDAFMLSQVDASGNVQTSLQRVAIGQAVLPASIDGMVLGQWFTIRSELEAAAESSACTRYDRSLPGSHPSEVLRRDALWAWRIDDPFTPLDLAQRVDSYGQSLGAAGRIPARMLMLGNQGRNRPQLVVPELLAVGYSGSNGVLLVAPFANPTPQNRDTTSRLLQ